MNSELVICRVRRTDEPAEVGEILERLAPNTFLVRWPDGETQELKPGNVYRLVGRASLRFQSLTNFAGLQERLRTDPVGVFVDAIRDYGQLVKTPVLKDQLVGLGLDRADIDAHWTRAKRAVDHHPNVSLVGKPPAYRWAPSAAESPLSLETAKDPSEPGEAAPPDQDRAGQVDDGGGQNTSAAAPVKNLGNADPAELPGHANRPGGDSKLVPESSLGVFEVLARLRASGYGDIRAALIGLATSTDDLSPSVLAAVLMLPTKDSDDRPLTLSADRWLDLIGAVSNQLEAAPRTKSTEQALTTFLRRQVSSETRLPLTLLVRWWTAVSSRVGEDAVPSLEALAAAAATAIASGKDDRPNTETLRRVATRLPLTPRGGRTRLMAALFRNDRTELLNEGWWHSTSLDDIAHAADGALSTALSDELIGERVVRPLVAARLRDLDGRRAIAEVMAYPASIVRWIESADLRTALRRAARRDPALESWLSTLVDDEGRAELEKAAESAEEARRHSEVVAAAASATAEEARERLAVVEQRLRDQQVASAELRQSEERQIRIGALRVAAEAAVVGLSFQNEALHERSEAMDVTTAKIGLVRIGQIGERLAWVPAHHEIIHGDPQPGDLVFVVRPGYLLRDSTGDHILVKSVVRGSPEG